MGYHVTDLKCYKCGQSTYYHYEYGSPYSRCYSDRYKCPICGHNPDEEQTNETKTEELEYNI